MDQLIAILRTLMKHWLKLVLVPGLTMALIIYMTANGQKTYKTEAKLYLNLQESKSTSLTDEDMKQYQIHTVFQNIVELLKSKKPIERVRIKAVRKGLEGGNIFSVGNENLVANREEVLKRLDEMEHNNEQLLPKQFPDTLIASYLDFHQLQIERLKDIVMSYRIMDSNFMKFELSEHIPEKTQIIANLFIEALIDENREIAKNKIKSHKDLIEGLVNKAKADLDAKIKKLENFKVENSIINLGEHTKAIVVYLVQLEGTRANLMAKVSSSAKGKSEVLSTVAAGNALSLDLTTNAEIVQLKEDLKRLNREVLTTSLEENNTAALEKVKSNVETTRKAINSKLIELTSKSPYDPSRIQLELASKYLNYELDTEINADVLSIIENEIQRVTGYSKKFAPFESTIVALEQEISTAQNVYLVLLNKLNLTQTMESSSGENMIEVIDPPYLPTKPEPSKRPVIVAAGGIAVFVLMAAVFIIIQLLDASIISVEKFERSSSLPVIGALPKITDKEKDKKLAKALQLIHQQQILQLLQLIISKCFDDEGILMLTSSQAGEGKHYIALELQSLLEGSGKKVAFVDADWMNENNYESLIDFKPLVENNGLIRNRTKIVESLDKMKTENDLVVLITSPINISAEAGFWMELSKHVLYIFGANRIMTKVDQRVEKMLAESRLQFLGTVINRVDIENMEDYLGEIPKKRTFIRRITKKLITRDF
jgi:polysaccharide biosynthesis transport protein